MSRILPGLFAFALAGLLAAAAAAQTCPDDVFEDNDSFGDAAPITAGTTTGLRACGSDDDYYAIPLLIGDEITIDVSFVHAEGDIDLALIDPDGTVVASATSATDDEQIVYMVTRADTYVIRVYLFADGGVSEGNDYDLDVVLPGPTCTDDAFEDNDSIGDPAPITAGLISDLRACPADDDYYAIPLLVGDEITIDVAFVHAEGDVDLALIDPDGTVVASATSATDGEQIVYTASKAGEFVIRVYLFADGGVSEGNDYDLDVVLPGPTCTDDAFEDNDSIGDPAPITAGLISDLRACPADDDYYAIPLLVGDEITIDVAFVHAEGDVDLALIDPDGTVVASATSATDGEQIVYTASKAGEFVIRVYLFADGGVSEGNDYDLDVVLPGPTCTDDAFEDNDSIGDPAPITRGTTASLRLCESDDDYFSIPLLAGDELTVGVTFVHAEGDIDLALIDPIGTVVALSESASNNEQIVYTAPLDGTFVIRVYLFADLGAAEGNDYVLEVPNGPAETVPATSPLGFAGLALLLLLVVYRAGRQRTGSRRRA